jgi:GT2 family glycosyltransferase
MFRAAAFRDAGGFDEQTFLYEEEFIMSERLRARGWNVISAPAAVYGHIGEHSTRQRHLHSCRCFIDSEQHLVRSYYRWPFAVAMALFVYRWAELGLYSAVRFLREAWRG